MSVTALGMIETVGLVSAIVAADAGLKAADVRLLGTDYVRGGLVMVRFEGDVAAVRSAVDAGSAAASRVGRMFSAHVIPRAAPEVFCMLASDVGQGPARRAQDGCAQCGGCEGGRRDAGLVKKRGNGAHDGASEHQSTAQRDAAEANRARPDAGSPVERHDPPNAHGDTAERGARQKNRESTPEHGGRGRRARASDAPRGADTGRAMLPPQEELEGWKVIALRSFVRTLPGFPLSPAEIRYATKKALMDALNAYRAGEV